VLKRTVALRICIECRSTFGLWLWPWSGSRFTRTHGLCRGCFERLERSFDDERPGARLSAPSLAAPAH
jgi:hypothetical protein